MKKVTIALDEQRELKFDINAMVELEERFPNQSMPELFSGGKVLFSLMRALATIGLTHGGMKIPGATVEAREKAVGDLIQEHWIRENRTLDELMAKLSDAFVEAGVWSKEAVEEGKKAAEAKKPNPHAGTGR